MRKSSNGNCRGTGPNQFQTMQWYLPILRWYAWGKSASYRVTCAYQRSISTIHFVRGWSYLTWLFIQFNVNEIILVVWPYFKINGFHCFYDDVYCMNEVNDWYDFVDVQMTKSMHLSFDFFTSQCTHPCSDEKKSHDGCIVFCHLHYNKIIFSH